MLEKTKLEEISAELPERERRELLAKITRGLERDETDAVRRVELKQEERDRLIAEELRRASMWERFVLWLQGLLSGRSRKDLFLSSRINLIKRSIKAAAPGLSGFETRNLTPRFARLTYDLYSASFPLRGLFQTFARDELFREQALLRLFALKYAEAKNSLEELVPVAEMESAYKGSGSEEEIRRMVLRRFNEYMRKVPDKAFQQLEEGLKPLVFFRGVVLFPYSLVFRHFNYFPGDRLDEKYPYFEHGSAVLVLDLLERLFAGLSLVSRLGDSWFCHEELLRFWAFWRRGVPEGEYGAGSPEGAAPPGEIPLAELAAAEVEAPELEAPELEAEDPELVEEGQELARRLAEISATASQFDRRVPLLDLLRYFRRDPYLRLSFAVPRLQLRPVYTSLLRERFLKQLGEKLAIVKKNVIDRRLQEIFHGEQLQDLFFYNDTPRFDFRKLGLAHFAHPRSLSVLYNFLSKLYKSSVLEVVQAANSYVYAGNRMVQARLLQCSGGLAELEAKIVLLDRSLSPEEDDGRTLTGFRSRVAGDLGQQKLYRSFIAQKDKEARALLDQGIDCLQTIQRNFDEAVGSPLESVKSALKTLHYHRGRNQTLSALLKGAADQIRDFLELLRQLLALEKGA
jgi:hypothetical protein